MCDDTGYYATLTTITQLAVAVLNTKFMRNTTGDKKADHMMCKCLSFCLTLCIVAVNVLHKNCMENEAHNSLTINPTHQLKTIYTNSIV